MLTVIDDLPDGVVGFQADHTVEAKDYEEVLIPKTEEAIGKFGKIGFIYVFPEDFGCFTAGAMYDDLTSGLKHWKEFTRIAVVTDKALLASVTKACAVFMPCPIKVFSMAQLEQAKEWAAVKEN